MRMTLPSPSTCCANQDSTVSPPDFHCLVAEEGSDLVGILVYHFVAFTYRAKPNLIIKELILPGHIAAGVSANS
jgi:hypothetical protein